MNVPQHKYVLITALITFSCSMNRAALHFELSTLLSAAGVKQQYENE